MNELRRAWGPNAISRWSIITASLALLAVALPAGIGGADGIGVRVLTAAGALAAGGLVLGIAGVTWLRPSAGGARWARALLTFAGAGAVLGATRYGLTVVAGAQDPIGPAWRTASGATVAVIWLAITAIVVDHVREHHSTMVALRRRQRELEDIDRREREELSAVSARLRDDLLAPARDALHRIETALVAVGAGASAAAQASRIEYAVERSIRPLSHEVLASDPAVEIAATDVPRGDLRTRLIARWARRVTHAPWIVTAVPVVVSPLQLGPSWGVGFLLVNAAITWPAYALMLILMRRLLEPRLQGMRTLTAGLVLAVGYATATAVAIAITWALGALSPRDVPYFWVGVITITAILLAASLLEAAADLATEDEHALRDVVARIAMSVARIRQRLRHENQAIGKLLHGPIQGALLGVAAALEQAPADLPDADHRALVEASLARLADVRARLEAPLADEQSIDDLLEGVMMLWARTLDIDLHLHDDARAALGANPAARVGAADVVAEALTNALRHGGARRVDVTITLHGPAVIVLVTDDGQLEPAGTPGMGSRLYDDASHEWSLTARPGGGTELRLVLPVAPSVG